MSIHVFDSDFHWGYFTCFANGVGGAYPYIYPCSVRLQRLVIHTRTERGEGVDIYLWSRFLQRLLGLRGGWLSQDSPVIQVFAFTFDSHWDSVQVCVDIHLQFRQKMGIPVCWLLPVVQVFCWLVVCMYSSWWTWKPERMSYSLPVIQSCTPSVNCLVWWRSLPVC